MRDIIRFYTREAGVRGLERDIAKICRKTVTKNVRDEADGQVNLKSDGLEDMLGVHRYDYGRADGENHIGQATGLAWTQVGGELLSIESSVVSGKGNMVKTGSLGDVSSAISRTSSITFTGNISKSFFILSGISLRSLALS